ncbi:RING-H2 finger protein ATL56 [Artemisia annua]|uniref:RING-H2 finger protein ATL56 n=1 Tax=Artemisia annua TaxID=35608 RepID=A0A2U1Q7N5_ARTAN|nr:RING-H2 finger protein ATL56 [Artemisia annua]
MSLILSLFLLFLGLAAIVLIHLLIAGSFLHRRRVPPGATMHHHLPPFEYPTRNSRDDDCSICLEGFDVGEICRVLPACDHVFHAKCVDTWLVKVASCPVCRTRVGLDSGEGDVNGLRVGGDETSKFLWTVGVGEICRVLPACDHVFHAKCVDTWLVKVASCPVCRTRVGLDSGEGDVNGLGVGGDETSKFLWTVGVGW